MLSITQVPYLWRCRNMNKTRLEAFSDAVLAIVLTIMVLELKVPDGDSLKDILPLWPKFFSYVLSFVFVGNYWNNHHHLLHAAHHVNGLVLWANMHLLFWLSLLPVSTDWMGENHFTAAPTALYGLILLMAAIAYWILVHALISSNGKDSLLAKAIGRDNKGALSILLYLIAIPLAYVAAWMAQLIYCIVALMWCIPDKRIERAAL